MARSRPAIDTLPEDTQSRIPLLVERSAPDHDRPHLSIAAEARLADVERRTAACYAALEDASARLRSMAHEIVEKGKK
jgi:hypothetical protein